MKGLIVCMGIVMCLCVAVFAGAYLCFHMAFSVPRAKLTNPHKLLEGAQYAQFADKTHQLIDEALSYQYEDVYTVSKDGLKLYGRYYHVADGAPVQLMMHGYQSISIRDFSGGLQFAIQSGYNVLLVDQRGHGKSEGRCLSFGIFEREDCAQWVDYIVKRCGADVRIVLVGISMGAATVLMASDLSLPPQVRCIVADSGYTSPKEIIQKVIRDRHYPMAAAYFLVSLGARVYGHMQLASCSAIESLKRTTLPVLFIHGEADLFVPCKMSRQMYQVCNSEKELLTVPDAGHGLGYMVDEAAYKACVSRFVSRYTDK